MGPRRGLFIGIAAGAVGIVLVAAVAVFELRPVASPKTAPPSQSAARPSGETPATFSRFRTLPPGTPLPSSAQCAKAALVVPFAESKRMNAAFNRVTGQPAGKIFPRADDPKANLTIAPRIDGVFTGTTQQILRWAACKWGIDEDLVLAQAAVESWWRQTNLGDWGPNPAACAPGHGIGVDGKAGMCPESYGILQNRYSLERSTWPAAERSTAMNADVAYAIWRACFEGYESWLNNVERIGEYAAGDEWGCIGRWFAGRWHTPAAETYIAKVKQYITERIWEQPDFQEP